MGDVVDRRGDLIHARAGTLGVRVSPVRRVDRDRGFFTRVGDAFSDDTNNERDLYVLAGKKVSAAAKESNLRIRAEENTTLMLEGLLGRLGYTDVRIVFEKPAPPTSSTS